MNATETLARSSVHAFAASIVGVSIGLATSVFIARALGPQEKGAYDLVLSTAILLALGLGLSLPSGITFAVARRASAARNLIGWIMGIAVVQAMAAAAILAGLARADVGTTLGVSATDSALWVVVPLLVAVLCVGPCLKAILVGNQQVVLASWLELCGRAITLLVLVGVALSGMDTVATAEGFVAVMLVGSAVGVGLYLPAALHVNAIRGEAGLRTVIRFAAPSHGANVLQYLNYRVDLFLVAYFRDLREVGLYALAVTLAQLVWLVSNAVATAVFARVGSARDDLQESANRTAALSRSFLVIQLVLAGILAILAKPLLQILYGTAFEPALTAIWLLLPGVAVFGSARVLGAHIAGLGRPHLNLVVSASSLVVTLALDLLLIPSFGMNGAAIASTASYASAAGVMALLFSRSTGVPLLGVFVMRRTDLRRVAAGLRTVLR